MQGFLNPGEILNQLDLKENMRAADFGSGSGGWAIPLAKILKEGQVFAIDVLEEPLSALKGKADLANLSNIKTVLADLEKDKGSGLGDNSLDLVLMTNLLFQAENKEEVFREAKRVLKKDGKVLVVDWKLDAPLGPKKGRVSAKEIKELAEKIGLEVEKPSTRTKLGAGLVPHRNEVSGAGEFAASIYHWGLIFQKP